MEMLLLAKQHGRLSRFNELWSCRRVVIDVLNQGPILFTDDCKSSPIMPPELSNDDLPLQNAMRLASPFTDPSPSPSPLGKAPRFQFYRFSFAGFNLPILGIGYFRPETTAYKICCYGGSMNQERCFLSSWEYNSLV
jgi:hypothetical protein